MHSLAAAQLITQQGANWQRAGGKGERPEMIKPPEEARAVNVVGAVDRSDIRAELARRRKRLGGS